MRIFKTTPQYQIMGKKKFAFMLSGILILVSIVGLMTKGLTYGIDFRSGTLIQVQFNQKPDQATIASLFQKRVKTAVVVTTFGDKEENEVLITLSKEAIEDIKIEPSELVKIVLREKFSGFNVKHVEMKGANAEEELSIQIQFDQKPNQINLSSLFRERVDKAATVKAFGENGKNEFLITLSKKSFDAVDVELTELVSLILKEKFSGFNVRRVETVGAKVGKKLKISGIQSALFILVGILVYIGFRFKVRYGVASVAALFHDVLITLGVFVFLDKEFTLTILAAIMTIIGYSLNDTIVVFDRVRENIARFPKKPVEEVINLSVNESLSRTILTSVTTFLVVFSLFIFGGEIIHDFSFAMLIGLVVGTYSSVFVASPVIIFFEPSNIEKNPLYKKYNGIAENLKQRFRKNKGKRAR